MADTKSKLEEYRTKAGQCEAQLQHATSKEIALDLAIGVAENLMKASSVAPPDEKKALKDRCRKALDLADRIKNSADWSSLVNPKVEGVTAVAPSQSRNGSSESLKATPSSSSPSDPSALRPLRREGSDRSIHSQNGLPLESRDRSVDVTQSEAHNEAASAATQQQSVGSHTKLNERDDYVGRAPKTTRIHRLKEPTSTRKRTTKESIILLKASVVNGFKFPPWDKDPTPAEFALGNEAEKFTDSRDLSLSAYQHQFFGGWIRAESALPPPSMFPNDTDSTGPQMQSVGPMDLVQDAATDCSVVASLCAGVARRERGHERILSNNIWPCEKNPRAPVLSPNGKYVVRLNVNGCWRKVTIDDRLPVSKARRLIHVIDRQNPSLLWPALLEKAYLKVRGGYDFPGSNSCSDLWTLTGWIPEEVYLQEAEIVPAQLWNRIHKAFQYGDVLVTLGTGKMSSNQERDTGLESQHSYVVLDMKESEDSRQLLVKNPWLEGRGWRGILPSTSADGHSGVVESARADEHPSTFWIGLDQVIQHYERLYLNWNPGLFTNRQDIHFEWQVKSNNEVCVCIVNRPQFSFTSKGSDLVYLLLSRHFRDGSDDNKEMSDAFNGGSIRPDTQRSTSGDADKGYMSIFVCRGNGEQVYVKDSYEDCTPYVSTPQCLLRWKPEANETYTVVIDQEDLPASAYSFSLCAFSNYPITLEPATQRYPIQKVETGAWTKHTAGGDTQSPRYFQNPQYTLEVRQRCSMAILLTSPDSSNPLNVKLAIGQGKRIYRLQSRDVLADSGNYQSGCAFAEAHDLQPGSYTLICSIFEAGKTGDYSLRVDSTSDFSLRLIPRDGAGLLSTKLPPAGFRPSVHKIAAQLFPRRNANFTIITRFDKATSPQFHPTFSMVAGSPLRLSVELGRGPERKFLMSSEGGEYSSLAIVRSEPFNLEPSILNYGGIWVVLDRLSGTGEPVEEWYNVEIFTDMPDAFQIGGWREWDD